MALNDVTFVKGQGGLGRPLPGEDHISGIIFYTSTLPSGFSSTDRIKKVFSVEEAEDLGITDDFSDETAATGSYLVTNAGAAGDIIELKVQEYVTEDSSTGLISLGAYTRSSAATTAALVATDIAATINAGTSTHGYTASVNTATVTITARDGMGIFLNSGTPITATITGTIAGTITQFSGGAYSKLSQWHYHISEYFRIQPKGELYIGMYGVPSTYDFSDVQTVQNYATGKIRQFAVFCDGTTYTSAKVQAAQTIAATLETAHMPCSILVTFDYSAATLSALADLSGLNSPKVSVVIGQDGFATGYRIYKATGRSITNLGNVLGAVSFAKVSEDIAWLGKFNLAAGEELDVPAFANGVQVSASSTSLLTSLDTNRYIFLLKQVGYSGTYVNDSHTCVLESSDYAYIENNRTIDKAIRLLRVAYLPSLNGPLVLNSDGTLTDVDVAKFEGVGETALDPMVRDQELSDKAVTVNTTQNIQSTNQLAVSVDLIGIGVARNIDIKIQYVQSI
jgi:hypothetical protein